MRSKVKVLGLCVGLILSACGDDQDSSTALVLEDPAGATAADPTPLAVNSTNACALDIDCALGTYCFQGTCASECSDNTECAAGETCDTLGQCVTGAATTALQPLEGDNVRRGSLVEGTQAAAPDVLPGLRIKGTPETVFYVVPGQSKVTVTLPLNAAAPATGVAYILRRSDSDAPANVVRRMRAMGDSVVFDLEVGTASPDSAQPKSVRIELISAVGTLTIALVPEQSASGRYSGDVRMQTFGSTGVPIDFEIVTSPDGATLSEADSAWVVLPLQENSVFSPSRYDASPEELAAELVFDDFTQTWVANFRGAFDLTDGGILNSKTAVQVERQIRFELNLTETGLAVGQFRDIWGGLYEARSANGVLTRENVTYEGEFSATKIGIGRAPGLIDTTATATPAEIAPLPGPDLSVCDFDLSGFVADVDGTIFECNLPDAAAFETASPQAQAECAMAVARSGLSGETTAGQIKTYLDGGNLGVSFSVFMADCSRGTNGTCRPSSEVTCSRQLLAAAYRNQTSDSTYVTNLLSDYLDTTREQFLGAQFGSLQSDTETRIEWLKSTEYPAIATNLVRDLNERLLNEWQANVLDVHFEVLRGQFDDAGLITLAREPEGQAAIDARTELLLEMNQSFRTALESLTIAAQRWDVLFTEADKRREKSAYVSAKTRDLYIVAGVLRNLNAAGGAGFLSAGIGAGFGALQRESARLAQSFNQMIYARDAEVAVSTSLDPTVTNATLLNQLQTEARTDIATALTTVTSVVAQEEVEMLTETQLRNGLNNEIDDLKSDLVNLCGMPKGCSVVDVFADDTCKVRVNGGECGFVYSQETQKFATEFAPADLASSDGGNAIFGVLQAANNVKIAKSEVAELNARVQLKYTQTGAFARSIDERAQLMQDNLDSMVLSFNGLAASQRGEISALSQNIADRQSMRADSIESSRAEIARWDTIRFATIATEMLLEIQALTFSRIANSLEGAAGGVMDAADAAKDGLPTSLEDAPSAVTRLALGVAAVNGSSALSTTAFAFETTSQSLELASNQVDRFAGASLDALNDKFAVDGDDEANAVTALIEESQLASVQRQADREAIQSAIQLAKVDKEMRLAVIRDVQELTDRRNEILVEMTKLAGLNLRVAQAQLQYEQRIQDYGAVVQRAQLIDAKLNELINQRQHVNLIVGSPIAIFSRANRIVRAENKLELAKDSLMNWLVALEYYAVRPFMDQRIQILLARNPYQLEEIADEMFRLQGACGGSVNDFTAELSVRKDFLGLTQPQVDLDGTIFEPAALFRDLLRSGYIPVDKRTRYTTDQNIGDLMSRTDDILSASVYVDLEDFANLGATCNAKLASLDIQLVGDIGDARPTVSILYDGTGELRSCQPGIDDYVAQFGVGATSFGSVTYVRSAGRSVSPVAGINAFVEDAGNTTLVGLPLSSQYTVLIDTKLGENTKIDWSKLEDIKVRVSYSYQDLFPQGQCE
jgi:hypothetical protein